MSAGSTSPDQNDPKTQRRRGPFARVAFARLFLRVQDQIDVTNLESPPDFGGPSEHAGMSPDRASAMRCVAKSFGLEVIDYERPGDSLLLAAGPDLIAATMAAAPRLRFAIDVEDETILPALAEYLVWAHDKVGVIVVHAWYASAAPERLAFGLSRIPAGKVFVRANVDLPGRRLDTFEELGALAA